MGRKGAGAMVSTGKEREKDITKQAEIAHGLAPNVVALPCTYHHRLW